MRCCWIPISYGNLSSRARERRPQTSSRPGCGWPRASGSPGAQWCCSVPGWGFQTISNRALSDGISQTSTTSRWCARTTRWPAGYEIAQSGDRPTPRRTFHVRLHSISGSKGEPGISHLRLNYSTRQALLSRPPRRWLRHGSGRSWRRSVRTKVLLPHESTHPAWRELPNIRLERAGLAGRSPGALAAREERMSQSERWQLGGNAPEVYETELVPALFGPWAPLLVAKAALREGERVLDVACGTGVVTRLAAEQVGTGDHVVGVDLNPGMLARARAASVPQGTVVEWREADAGALPFS